MNTYYRKISLLFAFLAIITTNTSYYSRASNKAQAAKDWAYEQKDTVVRAARNNPRTAIGIGFVAGVGILLLSSRVRNRMRDLKDWGQKKYNYGLSDRVATSGQKKARTERAQKEQEELQERAKKRLKETKLEYEGREIHQKKLKKIHKKLPQYQLLQEENEAKYSDDK